MLPTFGASDLDSIDRSSRPVDLTSDGRVEFVLRTSEFDGTDFNAVYPAVNNTKGPNEIQGDFAVYPSRANTAEWDSAATIDWATSLAGPTKPTEHIVETQGAEPALAPRIVDELFTLSTHQAVTRTEPTIVNNGFETNPKGWSATPALVSVDAAFAKVPPAGIGSGRRHRGGGR